MASNPISSIGVGSGLPLGDLLTQLRTNENTALKLIQTQQISAQNKLSAYGKIKQELGGLQSAAQTLNNADTYCAPQTSVNGEELSPSTSTDAIENGNTTTQE